MADTDIDRGKAGSLVCKIRRMLVLADDIIHVSVAITLLASAALMLYFTAANLVEISISSILLVINDVLFVLIIMELLWTVIRYLRRLEFSLLPFIAIGIISSLRRILMIEAQMSMTGSGHDYYMLAELGVSTSIVFVLVIAYYLISKSDKEKEQYCSTK
jgi:uncharacterized membrane protein (DUF373 family)